MAKPRRVAVLFPDKPVLRGFLRAIVRAFQAEGVAATGLCRDLSPQELKDYCERERPDVILEMNRVGCELGIHRPKHIKHVAWIVDLKGRSFHELRGSDLVGLFSIGWLEYMPNDQPFMWLPPAASPDDFEFAEVPRPANCDVAYVGHIPNPWSAAELGRVVDENGRICFADLWPGFERRLKSERRRLVATEDYLALALDCLRELGGTALRLDEKLRYDLAGRSIRLVNRYEVVETVVDHNVPRGRSLHLYGPSNWQRWPAFAGHYQRHLLGAEQLAPVYRGSAINLHEGTPFHFRTLECMCAGGLLLKIATDDDQRPGGFASEFSAGDHYLPFTVETLPEDIEAILANEPLAARIRRLGAQRVREAHTWQHRVRALCRAIDDLPAGG